MHPTFSRYVIFHKLLSSEKLGSAREKLLADHNDRFPRESRKSQISPPRRAQHSEQPNYRSPRSSPSGYPETHQLGSQVATLGGSAGCLFRQPCFTPPTRQLGSKRHKWNGCPRLGPCRASDCSAEGICHINMPSRDGESPRSLL